MNKLISTFSISILAIFAIVGTVSAATTISTDISTGNVNISDTSNYMQGGKNILYASSTPGSFFGGEDAGKNLKTAAINATANTALGYQALYTATSSQGETAVGYKALFSSMICPNATCGNTAVGREALFSNTIGQFNTALGYKALNTNTEGFENVATGLRALNLNTLGSDNSAYGFQTMFNNTIGTVNSAFGQKALFSNTTGSNNTAVGQASLFTNNGTSSTAIGHYSLKLQTTGSYNIGIGESAGLNVTTASSSIIIGSFVDAPSATTDGQLNIGNLIYGTGIYQGNTNSSVPVSGGRLGIGIASPTSQFQVASTTSNATTSVEIGRTAQNKGSCLVLYDSAGTAVYAYVAAGATTFTLSSVSCK